MPFFFVSAADGTNVVKVFQSAILEAKRFKESGGDFLSNLLETLEGGEVIKRKFGWAQADLHDNDDTSQQSFNISLALP